MSLYKDASLVMIPSAYKDGKLYSIRPTDGSGDFTFSRGSNLAATRVDVNGLIEKGRENLLLQSNNFNTTWSKPNSTLNQGFSGYDGSNDAWKWSASVAGTIQLSQGTTGVSGMRTLSLYAKAGSRDVFSIWVGTGIDYNLTTGQAVGHANASMESVGNGWWRCSYFNDYGTLNPYFVASAAGEFIYIMNAQAEMGLVATDYIETGASTAQAGILEDMPRLDYSGSCPALLLEPQRTNLIPFSEFFDPWNTDSGEVKTANTIQSPEGLVNGNTLRQNNGASQLNVYKVLSVTSGANYSFSVWLKKKSTNQVQIYQYSVQTPVGFVSRATIDFDAGTITDVEGSGATIEPYEDGWFRCSIKCAAPSTSLSNGIYTPTAGQADVYAYGAQVEAGSYPTSYIPTYGSSVTRSLDVCKKTNIDSLIAEEGTAFIDVTNGDENEVNAFMTIADTSVYPDHIWIGQNGTTLSLYVKANDSYSLIANNIASVEGRKKIAVVYTNESIKVFVNGTNEYTANDKTLPSQLNRVELGAFNTSINTGTARYDQAVLFPTALTDSECIALTTL